MTANRTCSAPLAALLTVVPALTGLASAQVPDGTAVIGTSTQPGSSYVAGNPGLFLAPLGGGPLTTVTGLPPELTTDGFGGFGQGAYCVSHRSSDGAIIVSMIGGPLALPSAGANNLWIFQINSSAAVIQTQQIYLGTANVVGRAWHCLLPDDRILVAAFDGAAPFNNGPMAGRVLGVVDTSGASPALTTLPDPVSTSTAGYVGGMAIAPAGDAMYFASSITQYLSPSDAYVHRYDLTTGQTCLIATLYGESAFGIACDDDGTIHVSATNPTSGTHSIYSVVPDGCNPATVTAVQSSNLLLAWGLDLDRASGRFAAGSNPAPFPGPQFNALSLIDPVTGATTVIASAPAGGWGTLGTQGFAVNNAIESYGASSDGSNRHWFANFPNPGGQPTVGNLGFSLTLRSEPSAAALSLMALSFGRGSTPFSGIDILLDLNTIVAWSVPSAQTVTCPLAIPNMPALSGQFVTVQSLHLEPDSSLTASRGLMITIQ